MSVQFCLALLALSSLTAASDPVCEDLLKPLENRSRVAGKWIFHAGVSDTGDIMGVLKDVNSSWIKLTPIPGSEDMTLRWGDKINGKCVYGNINYTTPRNDSKVTLTFNETDHLHTLRHLGSCTDCILWTDTTEEAITGRNLYIFTKTGKLDDLDLEVVKQQAACLKFPTELFFADITDMAAQLVVALLAFTSLSVASDPNCTELVKPLVLDSHSPIYGRWVLHVGTWDQPGLKSDLVSVNGSWVDLSASSDSGVMTIYWADRLEDKCLQGLANATISGMTSHTTFNINGHTSYHDGKYYETCSDCLLSEDTTFLPDGKSKGRYFFLFTRTGALEPSELEIFKKQAECLQFLPEYYFGGTDLCPDEREPAPPAAENTESQTDEEPTAQ
ncbi:hypothetical protein OYC64_002812 [Pagothenia borchgrevinki]|uniref:Uncharacterized protein n=1 Tax=Pagothenia borchgrevinki TaxID=8213 RepID=A0ABD2HB57_PAGBO